MSADTTRETVQPGSLATLLILALVTVTTLVLAVFGVVTYRSQATEQWRSLDVQLQSDVEQASAALALPLWNFDRPQIERVAQSMLIEDLNVAVRLREFGGRAKTTVWLREPDGPVREVADEDFATNGLVREVRTVQVLPDTLLGTVELFVTPEFLRSKLRWELAVTVARIVAVDAVLSLALYLVFYRWVLDPLKVIQRFASAVSSGSAAHRELGRRRFSGELETLRRSIEKMVAELELRFAEKNKAESELRRQAQFDEMITRLMGQFVSATPEEIDDQVVAGLREIAAFMDVELAVVIQLSKDRSTWSATHEWVAPERGSRIEHFQDVPMGPMSWVENRVLADKPVAIGSRRELPPDAFEERQLWEREGYQAELLVPLRARGGHVNGTLCLISCSRAMSWRDADIANVQILSEAVGNTLERKRAEESLLQSREQLRALTARLQSLREEERTRLSREIHDHLGQLLTALKLDLRSAERKVTALHDGEAKTVAANKLSSAQKLADETLVSVQKIASELRPGILDGLGLPAAIESEARAFESRTGVRCECRVMKGIPDIPQEHATATYRIFQELLTNIARHAKATHARVVLNFEGGALVLEVKDDGVGMRRSAIDDPKSLGILGVRERAAMFGGSASIQTTRGKGTTVIVTIPIDEQTIDSRNETNPRYETSAHSR
jgi:signal transduction histidine kinase